ncbi:hypothetical protein BDB01DRAFT_904622 [Pilobolus umbonatus]|nr:hypothetical protein BDB01DRAFT_904622 [Pilobolus umbonatus]
MATPLANTEYNIRYPIEPTGCTEPFYLVTPQPKPPIPNSRPIVIPSTRMADNEEIELPSAPPEASFLAPPAHPNENSQGQSNPNTVINGSQTENPFENGHSEANPNNVNPAEDSESQSNPSTVIDVGQNGNPVIILPKNDDYEPYADAPHNLKRSLINYIWVLLLFLFLLGIGLILGGGIQRSKCLLCGHACPSSCTSSLYDILLIVGSVLAGLSLIGSLGYVLKWMHGKKEEE